MSTHDQTIRAVFGVTLETVVRRIVRTFERANKSDVEAGARWYDEAGDLAQSLTGGTLYDSPVSLEQAASVIAAMSPRTTWARNVAGAVALIEHGDHYPGIMTANYELAVRALSDGFDALNGPKTNRFARNITGDRESVTVDVWACRVASLDETLLSRKGAYDAIEHAYRLAARRVGVDPATCQATTWIVARNGRAS